MLNGQLLIDFHVHLPQYAERTNSARSGSGRSPLARGL